MSAVDFSTSGKLFARLAPAPSRDEVQPGKSEPPRDDRLAPKSSNNGGMPVCPNCDSSEVRAHGKTSADSQRYICRICGSTFTPEKKEKYSREQKQEVVDLVRAGRSYREAAKAVVPADPPRASTVGRWIEKHEAELQNRLCTMHSEIRGSRPDLTPEDYAIISHAFQFVRQRFFSKDNIDIKHCLRVARQAADWGLTAFAIAAALLHDFEDRNLPDQLKKHLGDSVLPIKREAKRSIDDLQRAISDRDLPDYKAPVVMEGAAISVINLIDHMRHGNIDYADEELKSFIELANSLSIWPAQLALEDLWLEREHKEEYLYIKRLIEATQLRHEIHVAKIRREVYTLVVEKGLAVPALEQQYIRPFRDVWRMAHEVARARKRDYASSANFCRILAIVDDEAARRSVDQALCNFYGDPDRRKDHGKGGGKANNYRGLHLTFDIEGIRTVFQLLTWEEEEVAQYGTTVHSRYLQNSRQDSYLGKRVVNRFFEMVRNLREGGR